MTNSTETLKSQLMACVSFLNEQGVTIPLELASRIEAHGIKTYDYFLRVLTREVRDLYNGASTQDEFIDSLAALIEQQYRRAWNAGMRENGLDPARDMTDAFEQRYQELVTAQFEFIDKYAKEIAQAAADGKPIDGFLSRAELWANGYNNVDDIARLETAPTDLRFKWVYGDTEHCGTCAMLNGIVATAKEWMDSGYKPQNAPNDMLECGGWRCQCVLEATDDDLSPDGIP